MNSNSLFKSRLKEAMLNNNMRQKELTEITKISKSSLSQYLSGKYLPKKDNIKILAEVLNVPEDWLFGNDTYVKSKTEKYCKIGDENSILISAEDYRVVQILTKLPKKNISLYY